MARNKPKGWVKDPVRHGLAAKGIKTKTAKAVPPKKPAFVDVKQTAKMIRQDLKKAFPGANFSVRLSRYSMGSSVDVRWVDGPAQKDVETIIEVHERIDRDAGGNILSGGNRFIFAERSYSPEERSRVTVEVLKKFPEPKDFQAERWLEDEVWRTLQTTTLPRHEKTFLVS